MEDVKNKRIQELDQTDRSQKGYIPAISFQVEPKNDFTLDRDYFTQIHNKGIGQITVFGNDIKQKSPFKIGKVYSLLYCDEQPMIIVGPQCKIKPNLFFYN